MDQTRTYPGQRLGLPEDGPRSVASWGARFVALLIDWAACWLVALFLRGVGVSDPDHWIPVGVFVVEASVLTTLVGGSFGQVALRLAVVRLDGKAVNLLQALLRSILICLVIPPLVFNRDNRGIHDLAVGTVVIRR